MNLPLPKVDISRLTAELDQLAAISECSEPPPAVTRVVFTPTDIEAREFLRGLYEAAGLKVRVDAVGNTLRGGREPTTGHPSLARGRTPTQSHTQACTTAPWGYSGDSKRFALSSNPVFAPYDQSNW